MTDDLIRIEAHTRKAHTQRKGHVRTQQNETIYKPRRKASGDIKTAEAIILNFQPPKL